MATYAILDGLNNVINVIEWDGVSRWSPPSDCIARLSDGTAEIGGTWTGSAFLPAPKTQGT